MRKITNYNAGITMCAEKTCDKKPTWYDTIDYYGLEVNIAFCDKHYQDFAKV